MSNDHFWTPDGFYFIIQTIIIYIHLLYNIIVLIILFMILKAYSRLSS